MIKDDFEIPIDNEIEEFRHHLDIHDRTILSARFGEGKSYFLSKFVKDLQVAENYTFLTIYPVNYQVVENRDIFDLIKRDILLQMAMTQILTPNVNLTNAEALMLSLQCKPLSFVESFLPLLTALSQFTEDKVAATTDVLAAGWGVVKRLISKIKEAKESIQNKEIDDYLAAMEDNPVVSMDVICKIIKEGINRYKEKNPGKKVVLVIEDMDRIDPRHIFRILNVFSAHIDYCYHLGYEPDSTLHGNKFGLDKVLFVLDYDNLRKIYKHFYGEDANFEGYIEKFCSSTYFRYSLKDVRDKYILQQIVKETALPSQLISNLLKPEDIEESSIRHIVNSINNSERFIKKKIKARSNAGVNIPLHQGILRLIAIMRKFGLSNDDIVSRLKAVIEKKNSGSNVIFPYIAPYLCMSKFSAPRGVIRYRQSLDSSNSLSVSDFLKDGTANCYLQIALNDEKDVSASLANMLHGVLNMVKR